GAGSQMLFLVDLEVLGLEGDRLDVPAHRVADRAHAVDRRGVVAELVGPCFGKEFPPRARSRDRVVPGAGLGQRREDLFQRRAADLTLARRRESELSVALL